MKVPRGLSLALAQDFREATKAKFAELGFTSPAYTLQESEEASRGGWRLRVADAQGQHSYELVASPDRVDPQRLNIQAVAYSGLDGPTANNRIDEWRGSVRAGGEQRLYLEAINAVAMVLSWIDPMVAPEAGIGGLDG